MSATPRRSHAPPPHAPPPLFLLLGPTASGKSAIAMALAQRWPIEIVSVDSALVYRGMDIGTAKPTTAERASVRHHLIDLIEPTQAYSAARFATDARRAIDDIRARGRLPLLAGGTMLYARALVEGLHPLPKASAELRAAIERDARELGWPALHARLAESDPATAARLAPRDAQRIQRALEVLMSSGRPLSEWLADAAREPRANERVVTIALEPGDRGLLHQRIAARFDRMLAAGFLEEVRALRARGDLHAGLPAMRSVGYRQAWEHLDARYDARQMRERAIAATRQLAKRQLTWLRADDERVIVDCLAADAQERVERVIERELARTQEDDP